MVNAEVNARLAAVETVATGLRRFHDLSLQNTEAAERATRQVGRRIEAEHDRRCANLSNAQRRTAAAEAALAQCPENCDGLARAVSDARQNEAEWRERTRVSAKALQDLATARSALASSQRTFTNQLLVHAPAGAASAEAYLVELQAYLATNDRAPAGASRGTSQHPVGVGGGLAASTSETTSVELSQIRDDRDGEALNFEKTSREQVEWGLDRLKSVVEPALAMGKGADYFAARDKAEGLAGEHSYSGVYQWFYNDSHAIKLSRLEGGGLDITDGYHRVRVAKELGIEALPARVR